MKPLFASIFVLAAITCFAQKQNVYYLKNNGRYVQSKDSADFTRIVSEPDSGSQLYNITEFYKSGKRKFVAKSSTINPLKLEGISVGYYENGVRKSIYNHKNNLLVGDQYRFFPNGKPYLILNYIDKTPSTGPAEFTITANYDSLGTALVTNGNGYYRGYDRSFKIIVQEGPVKNGRKDGEWKLMDSLHTAVEKYTDGKFISGTATYKDGEVTNYTALESKPEFPGGESAFFRYLSANIHYPEYERKNNITGKVIVQFIIDKDGKISAIRVLRHVSPAIDDEALRVIAQSPTWKPGTQNGRAIRTSFVAPINFTLN